MIKCMCCGAPLPLERAANGLVECEYCRTVNVLPKPDIDEGSLSLLNIAKDHLLNARFDDAWASFYNLAQIRSDEPEAYFGIALAEERVVYLRDFVNNRAQPICYAVTDDKFGENPYYQRALELATAEQRKAYADKAEEIDFIRSQFKEYERQNLNYDCFICAKVTEADYLLRQVAPAAAPKTADCHYVNDGDGLYNHLIRKGFKPFFSEVDCKLHTGADYEALILYALHKAKCLVIVCRDKKYLNTSWVKNEFTRFYNFMTQGKKALGSITIVFNGNPVELLPVGNVQRKIQGIDGSAPSAYAYIEDFISKHLNPTTQEEESKPEAEKPVTKAPEVEKPVIKTPKLEKPKPVTPQNIINLSNFDPNEFEIEGTVLKKYKGNATDVVIPDGITEISDYAFDRYPCFVKSIILPNSVTHIHEYAFRSCHELEKITIPESVTHIGYDGRAFYGCDNLKTIIYGGTKKQWKELTIKRGVVPFTLVLPYKCRVVYKGRPPKNTKAEKPVIKTPEAEKPKPVTPQNIIDLSNFDPNEFEIEGTVLKKYKGNNSEVIIPDGVTRIDKYAFNHCTSITSVIIPNSVKSIEGGAFSYCSSLKSINIPNSITYISWSTFFECTSLENITIPNSVSSIGKRGFDGCSSLSSITIPNSVTYIDWEAFMRCGSLKNLYYLGTKAQWQNIATGSYTHNPHIPEKCQVICEGDK